MPILGNCPVCKKYGSFLKCTKCGAMQCTICGSHCKVCRGNTVPTK
jgi:hypothetical protein